ncbi:hypothetical protein [Enterovibrio nigricans]|uniref:hypothetical protein n=1 Tax=Enterovibrio nigricans TaxID=504469 RepID=UPI000C34A3F3|nr:hypothetical protein [Enterovibrio nigricans]PKF49230.1 hypothetical protein AT251_20400 [Enterovibrio nigricans]
MINLALGDVGLGIANVVEDIQEKNQEDALGKENWACLINQFRVSGELSYEQCVAQKESAEYNENVGE